MRISELIVMVLVVLAAWVGFAHVTQRGTTRRLVDLALDIADGVLEEDPIEAFRDQWTPRYEAAIHAMGLTPTRGQWSMVFAAVRDHVVAHAYSRGKFSAGLPALTEGVLAGLRMEEERCARS